MANGFWNDFPSIWYAIWTDELLFHDDEINDYCLFARSVYFALHAAMDGKDSANVRCNCLPINTETGHALINDRNEVWCPYINRLSNLNLIYVTVYWLFTYLSYKKNQKSLLHWNLSINLSNIKRTIIETRILFRFSFIPRMRKGYHK